MLEFRYGKKIVMPSVEKLLDRNFLEVYASSIPRGGMLSALRGASSNTRPSTFTHEGEEYHFSADDVTKMARNVLRDSFVQVRKPTGHQNSNGSGFQIATFETDTVSVRTQSEVWALMHDVFRGSVEVTLERKAQ